jgi:general secretion pathway protein G
VNAITKRHPGEGRDLGEPRRALDEANRHPGEGRDLRPEGHSVSQRGPGLRRDDAESGFTLVELMVVLVIIGLLATVVIINVMPATDKAAHTKAQADIATLEQGVEMYRLNKLQYPGGENGLQALLQEKYIKRLPNDPWGNPYHYSNPGRDGRAFDIVSYGSDGRPGGEGRDADIGSWQS